MMKMIRKMMTTYITHKLNIWGICNRKFNIRNRKFNSVHSCALYFEVKLFQHFIGPICLLNLCGRVTLLIHFTGLKFTTFLFHDLPSIWICVVPPMRMWYIGLKLYYCFRMYFFGQLFKSYFGINLLQCVFFAPFSRVRQQYMVQGGGRLGLSICIFVSEQV